MSESNIPSRDQYASHNLDAAVDQDEDPPSRDVREADFAAEAHGFTGFERAGRGSTYRGEQSIQQEAIVSKHILKGENIEHGPLGDLQLAQGQRAGLRIWRDYVTDEKNERKRSYEIVGYVVKGEITLVIDGNPTELIEGDSFVIPPDTSHRFSIATPATVIEATSPPAAQELG